MSIASSPAAALHQRMDTIRQESRDLPSMLREMASELPTSKTQRHIVQLASHVDSEAMSSEIARRFPELCWILTMSPGSSTADAFSETLSFSVAQAQLSRKRIRAITYPCVITLLSIGLFLVACATIVPIFDEMFEEFGLQLPGITLALVQISRFVVGQPFATAGIVALGLGSLAGVIWLWVGDSQVKRMLLGTSPERSRSRHSLAKAAIQVAELTEGGMDLVRTLQIVAASSTDIFITGTFSELAARRSSNPNENLADSRAARALPPNFVVALLGDEVGRPNPALLRELAANYRELSVDRRDWSGFIVAQLALILVGLMIGFMVIALFAPMVSLVTSLSS
ncbi:MAG: type II secretion system F family protein [Planctomycetota bacterium]